MVVVNEQQRRQLAAALESGIGAEPATILMDILSPLVGDDPPARRSDLRVLGAELRGEMAELRGEMAGLRGEMAELRGEMGELRGEMGELRGEIKAQLPRLITANIASMIGVAGLVVATAAVF